MHEEQNFNLECIYYSETVTSVVYGKSISLKKTLTV
jgi:hypothetical protein